MKLLSTYAHKHYIGIPEYRLYRSDALINVVPWYRFDPNQWRKLELYEDIPNVQK